MGMPIEEFIISTYCCVVKLLKEILANLNLRSRSCAPKFTDAEVITIEFFRSLLFLEKKLAIFNRYLYIYLCFSELKNRSNLKFYSDIILLKKPLRLLFNFCLI